VQRDTPHFAAQSAMTSGFVGHSSLLENRTLDYEQLSVGVFSRVRNEQCGYRVLEVSAESGTDWNVVTMKRGELIKFIGGPDDGIRFLSMFILATSIG
jgi:hypothetical protein